MTFGCVSGSEIMQFLKRSMVMGMAMGMWTKAVVATTLKA
jgi:hypothetical protein